MNSPITSIQPDRQGKIVHIQARAERHYTLMEKIRLTGKLQLPTRNGYDWINHSDIVFLKAEGNYTEVHTRNGKHLTSNTLKLVEDLLPPVSFVRVHRSYVVNVAFIKSYDRHRQQSHITLESNQTIPVSRRARILFMET